MHPVMSRSRWLPALAVLAWLASAPSVARADKRGTVAKPNAADYVVVQDRDGMYYALPTVKGNLPVFAGDGNVMRVQGGRTVVMRAYSETDPTHPDDLRWSLHAPRAHAHTGNEGETHVDRTTNGNPDASTWTWTLTDCKAEPHPTSPLAPVEAQRLLARARFEARVLVQVPVFLARDPEGRYDYVDAVPNPERPGALLRHRVFVGFAGQMTQVPMKRIAIDRLGAIYATKRGELRLSNDQGHAPQWTRGRKTVPLVDLDIRNYPDRELIYRKLGVYGLLGTPCEDD